MTGHSLGSHGLEQAELSFHLARDTVRYTEEHKICEWISHPTLDWFNGESNALRSAFPAVKIDDSHSLNWSSLIFFLDVPSQTNYVTWSYVDVSFLSWLNTSLKQSCESVNCVTSWTERTQERHPLIPTRSINGLAVSPVPRDLGWRDAREVGMGSMQLLRHPMHLV